MQKNITVFYKDELAGGILQEKITMEADTELELNQNILGFVEHVNQHGLTTSKGVWYPLNKILKIYV